MRVLVTGATGFIGRNLCRSLIADGHQVVALSRNAESARSRLPGVRETLSWNPATSAPPLEAFEGADAVINLAGESVVGLWTRAKKQALYDSRILSTRGVVSAIGRASCKPKVLISASAVGFYGDKGEEVITESSPPGSGFLSNLCVAWEKEALRASDSGLRVVRPRIGLVLGSDGGMIPSLLPVAKLGLSGRLGSGKQWWPWVHIDDVVGMMRFALANEVDGPLNATSPCPVRQKEFAGTLGRLIGRPSFLMIPGFLLSLAGGVPAETLSSERALPQRATQAGYKHRYSDLLAALSNVLGKTRTGG